MSVLQSLNFPHKLINNCISQTCPGQRCEELKNCVECVAYNSGPLAQSGCSQLCYHEINIIEKVEEDPENDAKIGARICRAPGDAGCTFVFKYHVYRGGTGGDVQIFQIDVQKERDCPIPVNVMGKCHTNTIKFLKSNKRKII